MDGTCAECRRRRDMSIARPTPCASCNWLRARIQSRDARERRSIRGRFSGSDPAEVREEELTTLRELATLLGEDGEAVLRRVGAAVRRGQSRVYTAELNRLTGKFLAKVEPF